MTTRAGPPCSIGSGFPFHLCAIRTSSSMHTNNALDVCMDDDVLIAHKWNGKPLPIEHGGPARVVIPKRYAWKGAKFIREIIFLERDMPGFWETRGYSNTADPRTEDRFAVKNQPPPGFP